MPCDTIQEAVVNLNKNTNIETLRDALKRLDLKVGRVGLDVLTFSGAFPGKGCVQGTYRNGKLTFPNSKDKWAVKLIKEAYSEVVVEQEAARMRWTLKKEGKAKYTATKPYSKDKIQIEVLADGTIKTTTDKISAANHASAEMFLLNMARAAGGLVTRIRRTISSLVQRPQAIKE